MKAIRATKEKSIRVDVFQVKSYHAHHILNPHINIIISSLGRHLYSFILVPIPLLDAFPPQKASRHKSCDHQRQTYPVSISQAAHICHDHAV